jgi:hypothetical protein
MTMSRAQAGNGKLSRGIRLTCFSLVTLYQKLSDAVHARSRQEVPLRLVYIRTSQEACLAWVSHLKLPGCSYAKLLPDHKTLRIVSYIIAESIKISCSRCSKCCGSMGWSGREQLVSQRCTCILICFHETIAGSPSRAYLELPERAKVVQCCQCPFWLRSPRTLSSFNI